METNPEELEPQNNQGTVVSDKVELTQAELDDLKHKAEVSSQNFERAKKAEQALRELELSKQEVTSSDVFSDEGIALKRKIDEQDEKIKTLLQSNAKQEVMGSYPIIKEKWEEFESFRNDPDNKGMNLKTAARAFLLDNGLLEPTRKGLERPTGGQRVPVNQALSSDDIKILRETNFRKYSDMLAKGEIKV